MGASSLLSNTRVPTTTASNREEDRWSCSATKLDCSATDQFRLESSDTVWHEHDVTCRRDPIIPPAAGMIMRVARLAGAAAEQIRAGDQPQDRQGTRHRRSSDAARPRRRGDRVAVRRRSPAAGLTCALAFQLSFGTLQPIAAAPFSRTTRCFIREFHTFLGPLSILFRSRHGDLPRSVSPFPDLLAQPAVMLHGLAGAEVLQLEDLADLDLALSLMRIWAALDPFDRFFLARPERSHAATGVHHARRRRGR
jgi:hypothetical protein